MADRSRQRARHPFQELAEILLLHGQGHFQNPRKNLTMAEFQCLLHRLLRIDGLQACVLVPAGR